MSRRAAICALSLLAALLVAAAGCGSSDPDSNDRSTLASCIQTSGVPIAHKRADLDFTRDRSLTRPTFSGSRELRSGDFAYFYSSAQPHAYRVLIILNQRDNGTLIGEALLNPSRARTVAYLRPDDEPRAAALERCVESAGRAS
ncbi:hypothetical protein [Paraconexibacter sp. AEG42_29]|uniref:hypothetical protein n=1 Tax=Paraconexibacter sp. AEG42_29 TaxID=2997339 RepID=UPI00339D82A1